MSLIVYFSGDRQRIGRSSVAGNSQQLAEKIRRLVEVDCLEIEVIKKYPKDNQELMRLAKREREDLIYPEFVPLDINIGTKDKIFLVYPIWFGTFPMAVAHFLKSYDFSNKEIYPFCTHEGSGFGSSLVDLKRLCSDSTIIPALSVWGSKVDRSDTAVENWFVHYQSY